MRHAKPIESLANVLVAPLISEKATRSAERENSVAFWVNPKASKYDIKQAVETFFPGSIVESVRTCVEGRRKIKFSQIVGQTKRKKKAYVLLKKGTQINFAEFEG